MKNKLIISLTLLLATISFSSCKKEPEDRIPGEWDMKINSKSFYAIGDSLIDKDSGLTIGTANFYKDGTGIFTAEGDVQAVTWSAKQDKVVLLFSGEALEFTIVEDSRKVQRWEYSGSETYTDYDYSNYDYYSYENYQGPELITYILKWKFEIRLDKK